MAAIARETAAVAAAAGVAACGEGEVGWRPYRAFAALSPRLAQDAGDVALVVAERTCTNVCSTLSDCRRGAPTEEAALGGYVARTGHLLGVPTPRNEAAWAAVASRWPISAAA